MSADTIAQAKTKMQELIDAQAKVDAGLEKMPEGADKERLKKLVAENRGFFSNYILPTWKKMQTYLSEDSDVPKAGDTVWYNPMTWFSGASPNSAYGALPLIPIAAVAAATALVGYVGNSIVVENRILSDPSFTAAQKTQLLQTSGFSAISNSLSQAKWLVLLGVIGGGAYLFRDEIKAMAKKSNPYKRRRK